MCITVPRMAVLEESCGILDAEIDSKRAGLAQKEADLARTNPSVFLDLQVGRCKDAIVHLTALSMMPPA